MPIHCLYAVKNIGYGGVDIFFFASGIGCWYSLDKNPDPGQFIYRRMRKILPMYECFLVFWIVFKRLSDGITITETVGNVFCIQELTGKGNAFNWYISAVWIMYFAAPFLYCFLRKIHTYLQAGLVLAVAFAATTAFWHSSFLVIASRFPVFLMGMMMAKMFKDRETLNKAEVFAALFLMMIGFAVLCLSRTRYADLAAERGIKWYSFLLIVPGLCLLLSLGAEISGKLKVGSVLIKTLDLIGKHTFEVYLTHLLIFDIYKHLLNINRIDNRNSYWWIAVLLVIMASAALHYLTKAVVFAADQIGAIISKRHENRNENKNCKFQDLN